MRLIIFLVIPLLSCYASFAQKNQMDFPPVKRERMIQEAVVAFCIEKADGAYHFTKRIDFFGSSTLDSVNCNCLSNKPHGPWELYVNKIQIIKGFYNEGREDGEWTFFHHNGKIEIKTWIKNGIMDGPTKTWYETGQKLNEKTYVNGLLEGKDITFFEDGHEWINITYRNGLYHGKFTQWMGRGFSNEHKLYFELMFENGKLHGTQLFYHINGKKHMEVIYEHDKVVSGKSWNEKGIEIPFNISDAPIPNYEKFF